MKKVSGSSMTVALLLVLMAVAFHMGRSIGFNTGSEWALVQADIVAREAGLFMPVYLTEGKFRVVIKQPRGLYKRAWQRADEYEEVAALKAVKMASVAGKKTGSASQKSF
jgi:hypothetical protein